MRKTIASKIILASFVVILCMSQVLWLFVGKFVDLTNYENRTLTTRPELTLENYNTFPSEYEAYFNDNLPFRNNLIALNTAIDYFVFSKPTNNSVIVGKDNWLFYANEEDGDSVGCYQGTNLMTEEELKSLAENCVRLKEYLESKGKEFVIFIAPNKERIYYDKMPNNYGLPSEKYRALQIVEYLREHTDVRVVYPYEELINAKNDLDENIYYKTDTHWNWIGGYVGSCTLLKELGIQMPGINSDEISITKGNNTSGDLAGLLNLKEQLKSKDVEYTVKGYNEHNVQNVPMDDNNIDDVVIYHSEGADPRKIYVYRDSFSTYMASYIGSQFNDTFFQHKNTYSYDSFVKQDPDIFVYETVERYVGDLADFWIEQSVIVQ